MVDIYLADKGNRMEDVCMNKGKIFVILLVVALVFSILMLTACDTSTNDDTNDDDIITDEDITEDDDIVPDEDITEDDEPEEYISTTITFDSNGGSEVEAQQLDGGQISVEPTSPTLEGYTFVGWLYNNQEYTFGTSHTEDITLTAQWQAITFTVVLDGNIGGTDDTIDTYNCTYGEEYLIPYVYYIMQYHVTSWNTQPDGSGTDYYDLSDISMLSTVDEDTVTLYAQWLLGTAGLQYALLEDGTYAVYSGSGTDVIVPAMYHGASVTAIYDSAFHSCDTLVSITIPDSVTSIGMSVFYSCENLVSVTLPDSITSIGHSAFVCCFSLEHITLPDNIATLSDSIFMGCTSLVSVDMPDSLVSIDGDAFSFCTMLSSIVIPQGVTSIDESAFGLCSYLIEVYNLSDLPIEAGSTDYGGAGYYAACIYDELGQSQLVTDDNGFVTYTDTDRVVLVGYVGADTQVTIPSNVTNIRHYCFYKNSIITSVDIPDNVISIGDSAFSWCSSIVGVTLPDSVVSIGAYAFAGCSSIVSITIGSAVQYIDVGAFWYCNSLQYIYFNAINATCTTNDDFLPFSMCDTENCQLIIGSAVESIDNYMFYGFSNLSSITFEGTSQLQSIGNYAFYSCESLSSVIIPSLVDSIGCCAFANCSSLQSVVFEDTTTWYYSFDSEYTYAFKVHFGTMDTLLMEINSYYYWYKV